MIVTCPACKRKYRLDDGLVESPFQKMRCSRCGHVFVDHRDLAAAEEERGLDQTAPLPGEGKPVPKRRGKARLVVSVLVFLGLVVAGYIYWMDYLGAESRWLSIQGIEGQEAIAKDGPVFLISGTLLNGSTKPRKRVVLKAKLFDENGAVIGERSAVAGSPLSVEDIAQMTKSDIEERAEEAARSDPSVLTLYPHKEMIFSIVLPGPFSDKPKEFSVEIVDSPAL